VTKTRSYIFLTKKLRVVKIKKKLIKRSLKMVSNNCEFCFGQCQSHERKTKDIIQYKPQVLGNISIKIFRHKCCNYSSIIYEDDLVETETRLSKFAVPEGNILHPYRTNVWRFTDVHHHQCRIISDREQMSTSSFIFHKHFGWESVVVKALCYK
jgi:hypothetical protein